MGNVNVGWYKACIKTSPTIFRFSHTLVVRFIHISSSLSSLGFVTCSKNVFLKIKNYTMFHTKSLYHSESLASQSQNSIHLIILRSCSCRKIFWTMYIRVSTRHCMCSYIFCVCALQILVKNLFKKFFVSRQSRRIELWNYENT